MTTTRTKPKAGKHPWEYRRGDDGAYWRKNKAGRWVKLNPAHPQHARAHAAARLAIARAEGGAA